MNVTEREYSLTAAAERGFLRDVKEELRYIGVDYDTVHKSTAQVSKKTTFESPDENFITIGAERFRCAEVLLLPDVIVQCVLFHCHRREGDSLVYDTQLKSTAKIDKVE